MEADFLRDIISGEEAQVLSAPALDNLIKKNGPYTRLGTVLVHDGSGGQGYIELHKDVLDGQAEETLHDGQLVGTVGRRISEKHIYTGTPTGEITSYSEDKDEGDTIITAGVETDSWRHNMVVDLPLGNGRTVTLVQWYQDGQEANGSVAQNGRFIPGPVTIARDQFTNGIYVKPTLIENNTF